MVKVREDLTGKTFNRLTVIEQAEDYITPKGIHYARWKCQCKCGNIINVVTGDLKKHNSTTSCGCWRKERISSSNKKNNDYEIQEDYIIMYTSKGEPFYIDLEDFNKVKDICWHIDNNGYVKGKVKGKETTLHRYIMNCPDGYYIDHIHGKKSRNNNCKNNLRIVTVSQNGMNVATRNNNNSGTTGVSWDNFKNKWVAYITINYKRNHLGYFDSIDDAIKVRKEAEKKYFGEFSYDNSQRTIGQ